MPSISVLMWLLIHTYIYIYLVQRENLIKYLSHRSLCIDRSRVYVYMCVRLARVQAEHERAEQLERARADKEREIRM